MKVLDILDIARKDVPIYYRRLYTGSASLELLGKSVVRRIEFSIETKPTGAKDIQVSLVDEVDYPLIPLQKALKDTILAMDRSGALPC